MILLCGCFFQKRQKATLAFRSLLLLSFPCFKIAFFFHFIFNWKYPAHGGERHIIHHSSSKRPVRHYLFLHTNRFLLSSFFLHFYLCSISPSLPNNPLFLLEEMCIPFGGFSTCAHGLSPFRLEMVGRPFWGKREDSTVTTCIYDAVTFQRCV